MQIKFIDKNNNLVELEIKIDDYISFCADYENGGGQCNNRIKPETKEQRILLNLWKKYHLRKNYPLHLEAIINKLADIINEEFRENIIDNKQSDDDLEEIIQSLDLEFDDNFYIACINNFELSIKDLEEITLESDYRYDGRGHYLNSYDGNEEEQTVFDETFYFYRR